MGIDLSPGGVPIVTVEVSVSDAFANSRFHAQMERPPRPIDLIALVDTGASLTVIDESVVQKLGLEPRGYCDVRSIHLPADGAESDSRSHDNFDISISVPQCAGAPLRVGNLQVISAQLPQDQYGVLIGRDLLAKCRLEIDFPAGRMEIEVKAAESPH